MPEVATASQGQRQGLLSPLIPLVRRVGRKGKKKPIAMAMGCGFISPEACPRMIDQKGMSSSMSSKPEAARGACAAGAGAERWAGAAMGRGGGAARRGAWS